MAWQIYFAFFITYHDVVDDTVCSHVISFYILKHIFSII